LKFGGEGDKRSFIVFYRNYCFSLYLLPSSVADEQNKILNKAESDFIISALDKLATCSAAASNDDITRLNIFVLLSFKAALFLVCEQSENNFDDEKETAMNRLRYALDYIYLYYF
jgi:hypothetical protein